MEILGAWLIGAFIVGALASNRDKGFLGYFLIALLLSPLIGLVILLVSGDGQTRAPCWRCRESVIVGASQCPHCGAEIVWNTPASAP